MTPATGDVTQLLVAWSKGDEGALEKLTPLVYNELHRLARGYMVKETPDHTLQGTALINEAYIRLIQGKHVQWRDRAHFFALSAKLMRRILVDFGRSRRSQKRGGARPVCLEESAIASPERSADLVALDEALEKLAAIDPLKSQIVELRFFGGLGVEETAEVLKVAPSTVYKHFDLAKLWLLRQFNPDSSSVVGPAAAPDL
jgi:RNA polymerase sigma factor (TIGR02999 family)